MVKRFYVLHEDGTIQEFKSHLVPLNWLLWVLAIGITTGVCLCMVGGQILRAVTGV